MGFNKEKTQKLLQDIDVLFDQLPMKMSAKQRAYIKNVVLGPALKDVQKMIEESRPPVMMTLGRSGHGKSSLINALIGKEVAKVNPVVPETRGSTYYEVPFEEYGATWRMIDTRGFFDVINEGRGHREDGVKQLKKEILEHRPDIFLHVINIKEVRTMSNDLLVMKDIGDTLKKENIRIPIVTILSNVDILGNPTLPIETPEKQGQIIQGMNYLIREVFQIEEPKVKFLNLHHPARGYILKGDHYVGIIPVSTYPDNLWNIDTLEEFIGEVLPERAKLDYLQVKNQTAQMKKFTTSVIKRFSTVAGGVGSSPIPVADFFVITPLQLLMIIIIGTLSGKEMKIETAHEYLAAMGLNIGAALGFRSLAHQLTKMIPMGGMFISGGIASSATYALGKSAEMYFFHGKVVNPKNIKGN
ncbi:GTPase [Isachenkonia alkalipeptolytica]|uniref:G domain-containing protein n=1 Tax=Isachenkonia alkalipeptolytica TaxID=2565777 RepID=A0AA43XLL2_9CLOT|nr:GTPase [Isachenkonia alkalipeptolytica]NBG88479.1 hypothetical protein [Isachenkonia alkalipeptolytica]